MDIRRFFSPVSSQKSQSSSEISRSKTSDTSRSKKATTRENTASNVRKTKKRTAVIIDSDSDDEFTSKVQKKKGKLEPDVIDCSPDMEKNNNESTTSESRQRSREEKPMLKPATVSSYFSDEPVKRSDAKDFLKKRKTEVVVNVGNLNKKEKEVIGIEDSLDSDTRNKKSNEKSPLSKRSPPRKKQPVDKDSDAKAIQKSSRKGCSSQIEEAVSVSKDSIPTEVKNKKCSPNKSSSSGASPSRKRGQNSSQTSSRKTGFLKNINIESSSSDESAVPNRASVHTSQKNNSSPKRRTSPRKSLSLDIDDEFVPSDELGSEAKESTSFKSKPSTQMKVSPASENGKEKSKTEVSEEEKLKLSAEKKRAHFLSYKNFMEREGPRALGTKTFPKGKESCFHGMTFIITGVLESFERDDVKAEIEKYGGKVVQSVSKKTSYIIIGRDPGQSKLEKAEKFGTKKLSEDEFLDLLASSINSEDTSTQKKSRSTSPKTKSAKKDTSNSARESLSNLSEKTVKKSKRKIDFESPEEPTPKKVAPTSKEAEADGEIFQMWVDKYKPTSTKQIIGQQGDKSNVKKLSNWLQKWHQNRRVKHKPAFGKWGKTDDGGGFRAALLSGPPGIGKTTSAQLVCKEAGYDFIELNASDQRSKKSLKEEIAELVGNQTLSDFYSGSTKNSITPKHVIVMDEVDGMAGNEDRGGVQELISLIKTTKVPIICICNDRSHPKIRSLVNYCYDLRFYRPRVEQMKAAMLSIADKEGVKIPNDVLQDVIVASNQDIRQVLHNLSVWCVKTKSLTAEQAKHDAGKSTKDVRVSPFDALRQVFTQESSTPMSIHEKSDLFFTDYSIMPLFVQENYLQVKPSAARGDPLKHLHLISTAADSISNGDLVDKIIRTKNNWSLLPVEAIFASVVPGDLMKGHLSQMITFPSWLGKNSSRGRVDRLMQELHMHMRLRISGNKTDVGLDYLRPLRDSITHPLIMKETEGVAESLNVMEHYCLLREDLDNIVELSLWPSQKDPMSQINPKVKAAFTRTYNKEGVMTPYSIINTKKVKRGGESETGELTLEGEDVENLDEVDESDDDLTQDAMVKVKHPKVSQSKEVSESSVSKGKGRGKTSGRGRGKR